MIKRILAGVLLFVIFYTGVVWLQMFLQRRQMKTNPGAFSAGEVPHKLYTFAFSKYNPAGGKEIEIEGDSANILNQTVELLNVVAKAYAEETPVTITADK